MLLTWLLSRSSVPGSCLRSRLTGVSQGIRLCAASVSVSLPRALNVLFFPADQVRILGGQAESAACPGCCPGLCPMPASVTRSRDVNCSTEASIQQLTIQSSFCPTAFTCQVLIKNNQASIPKLLLMVTKRQSLDSSVLSLSLLENCLALASRQVITVS